MLSKETVKRGLTFALQQMEQVDSKSIDSIITQLEEEEVESIGYTAFEKLGEMSYGFEEMMTTYMDEIKEALKTLE